MTQNEFFNILMDGLKDFPETKLHNIISYYENNFTLGLSSGKTEEEIIHKLGNPNLIVDKFRNENLENSINWESIIDNIDSSSINTSTDYNTTNNIVLNNDDTIFSKDKTIAANIKSDTLYNNFKTNASFNPIDSDNKENAFNNSSAATNSSVFNYNSVDSNKSNNNFKDESDFNSGSNCDNFSTDFINKNPNNKFSLLSVNNILRICIAVLALIIFFPVITGVIGCVIGLLGVAISMLVASIGVLVGGTFTSFIGLSNVPMFVTNFPYPVLVLFSLGSIALSTLLIFLFYYLCKFLVQISIKIYTSLRSQGGAF